jgi:hypothetical protein
MAHIISASIRDSDRTWTIQRADVDNLFGSIFESDFEILQHRGKREPAELFTEPKLLKKLRPKFMLEGREVDYFVASGPVSKKFSPLLVESRTGSVELGLKLTHSETLAALEKDWQVEVRADMRIQSFGALLHSAHLTMFELLGYRYALSSGGYFLGRHILGELFELIRGATKKEALKTARNHFSPFVNLVRPMLESPVGLQGTITDGWLLLMGETEPWGIGVLVRTGASFHTVAIPLFEEAERSARFLRFMDHPGTTLIQARLTRYAADHWQIDPTAIRLHWPEANFLN